MNYRLFFSFLFVAAILAFASRLVPHMPNFAPMGALALFVGAYVARRWPMALILAPALMFVSDFFIGFYHWQVMAAVYLSFLLYGLIGLAAKRKKASLLGGTLAGSIIFYLITNAAVWAFSGLYSTSLNGLILSYVAGLPFLRFTVLGDLFFASALFGSYALVEYLKKNYLAKQKKISFV